MSEDDHEAVAQQKALYNWQRKEREAYLKQLNNEHEAFIAEFTHYVSDLSADDAIFLKKVISSIGDQALQAEMCGILMGYLVYAKGRTTEGKDPDVELRRMLDESKSQSIDIDVPRFPAQKDEEEFPDLPDDFTKEWADDTETMIRYGVKNRFFEKSDGIYWAGVECVKCAEKWTNLEHRMENFDCTGCIQITKWGHKL